VLAKQATAEDDSFVGTLLHVLQKTIEFEQELGERYQEEGRPDGVMGDVNDSELDAELKELDTTTTVGIRRKYEILRIKESRQAEEARTSEVAGVLQPSVRYRGLVSDVFEPYLDYYISAEEKNMRATVLAMVQKETWAAAEDSFTKVLDSSAQMFLAIRESLKRCLNLNNEQAMYDLHQRCFRMVLQEYVNALKARIERGANMADRDIECCMIISTADYCHDTSGQLCESIKKSLSEEYAAMVNMTHEQNEFRGAQNKAIMALVQHVGSLVEPAFGAMAKMPWAMHAEVGDHSKYVDMISEILQANIPKYAQNLSPSFFNIFCQKLAEYFIPRFTDSIHAGCKKISNDGVQQLLVDTGAIRATLLHVPKLASVNPSNMFKKVVNKDMAKVEDLLRTLMSNDHEDPKRMVEVFKEYKKHNADLGIADFEKIVALTGFRKTEQAALVEQLKRDLKREGSG